MRTLTTATSQRDNGGWTPTRAGEARRPWLALDLAPPAG